jgi:phytol kinase
MIGILSALGGFGAVLVISECCYRFLNGRLISRKIAHIGAGVVTSCLPFLVTLPMALFFSLFFALLMLISQRYRLIKSVYEDKEGLGSLYFPLGMGFAALFFWGTPVIFSGAALLFAIPDGISGYIGKHFGHHAYSITGTKTVEGSVAFFASALMVFLAWIILFNLEPDNILILKGIVLALFLTIIKGTLGKGLDNLFLPVAAGWFLLLFI